MRIKETACFFDVPFFLTKHLRVLLYTLMVFSHDQLIKYLDMICPIGRAKFSVSVGIVLASRDWWIHEALKWLG